MSTELTINNLLPVLTTGKLSEKNATIQNTTFVGIDFGTSTTVVSIAVLGKDKEPLIVKPIELNQKLSDGAIFSSYKVPSVIAWYNNNLIVGEGAAQLKFKLRQGKNLYTSRYHHTPVTARAGGKTENQTFIQPCKLKA